jgi:hypothetical protein
MQGCVYVLMRPLRHDKHMNAITTLHDTKNTKLMLVMAMNIIEITSYNGPFIGI